jgi:hypothetical protein
MIAARLRIASAVYDRQRDRKSAGIALRANALPGGYPLLFARAAKLVTAPAAATLREQYSTKDAPILMTSVMVPNPVLNAAPYRRVTIPKSAKGRQLSHSSACGQ